MRSILLLAALVTAGPKEPVRQHAERALALLDAHAVPASSWSDCELYRSEIRRSARRVLDKLDGA